MDVINNEMGEGKGSGGDGHLGANRRSPISA